MSYIGWVWNSCFQEFEDKFLYNQKELDSLQLLIQDILWSLNKSESLFNFPIAFLNYFPTTLQYKLDCKEYWSFQKKDYIREFKNYS